MIEDEEELQKLPPLLFVSLAGHESSETFPDLNLDEPYDEGAELSWIVAQRKEDEDEDDERKLDLDNEKPKLLVFLIRHCRKCYWAESDCTATAVEGSVSR